MRFAQPTNNSIASTKMLNFLLECVKKPTFLPKVKWVNADMASNMGVT